MHALTEPQIRKSFVNTTVRERNSITLPTTFADLAWDRLDYLGWRDPKLPLVGYLVVPVEERLVGIALRLGQRQPRTRPQCSFCEDVQLPNEVAFYSAKLAGAAGRKGDTVGTLVCAGFECSHNVRVKPSQIFAGDDPEAIRQQRIDALRTHATGFARRILANE